jgi:hypothetical protein
MCLYLTLRAGAAALETAAALCAVLNLTYFLARSFDSGETPGRKLAAGVLALVSLGTLVGSAVLLSLFAAGKTAVGPQELALARTFAVSGAVAMAALVLRRLASR